MSLAPRVFTIANMQRMYSDFLKIVQQACITSSRND